MKCLRKFFSLFKKNKPAAEQITVKRLTYTKTKNNE